MHKKITVMDLSAAVTGLLIALNIPSTLNIGFEIVGCVFAIIIVKQLFGGIGQNFMNPALAARGVAPEYASHTKLVIGPVYAIRRKHLAASAGFIKF